MCQTHWPWLWTILYVQWHTCNVPWHHLSTLPIWVLYVEIWDRSSRGNINNTYPPLYNWFFSWLWFFLSVTVNFNSNWLKKTLKNWRLSTSAPYLKKFMSDEGHTERTAADYHQATANSSKNRLKICLQYCSSYLVNHFSTSTSGQSVFSHYFPEDLIDHMTHSPIVWKLLEIHWLLKSRSNIYSSNTGFQTIGELVGNKGTKKN